MIMDEILKRQIEKLSSNSEVEEYLALLNAKNLNEDLFKSILYKAMLNKSVFSRVLKECETMPFFTKQLYDELVTYAQEVNVAFVTEALILSSFADEKSLAKLVNLNGGTAIFLSNKCEKSVFDAYVNGEFKNKINGESEENLLNVVNSPFVTEDILLMVVKSARIARGYGCSDLVTAIANSPSVTEDILIELVNEFIITADNICNYNKVTPNVIKSLMELITGNTIIHQSEKIEALRKIMKHPNFSSSEMLYILDWVKNDTYFSISRQTLLMDIIQHPNVSEEVIIKIIDYIPDDQNKKKFMEVIMKLGPKISKTIRFKITLQSIEKLTKDKIESLISSEDGLTDEEIKLLLEKVTPDMIDVFKDHHLINKAFFDGINEYLASNNREMAILNKLLLLDDLPAETIEKLFLYDKKLTLEHLEKISAKPSANRNTIVAMQNIKNKNYGDINQTELAAKIDAMCDKLQDSIYRGEFVIDEYSSCNDILKQNYLDGTTTMMWGQSGVGKSARIFKLDPTATKLILKSSILPEEVIGGRDPNGKPGEIYPPHWYTVLVEKCHKEPNRQHILFIDEITNVPDMIKNLIWEIVGDRCVAGNEEWVIPENCTIMLAGNRPEESSAVKRDANGGVMPAPLHNRIASQVEIPFSLEEWAEWAVQYNPKKGTPNIHPTVFSYLYAHPEAMFTTYDIQNVTKTFLTPRQWEKVSDAIYSTEKRKNSPLAKMSKERLETFIGDPAILKSFYNNYMRTPIEKAKIEDGKSYSRSNFPNLEDKLYALCSVVAMGDIDHESAELFVSDCLGEEFEELYHNMLESRKIYERIDANTMEIGKGAK